MHLILCIQINNFTRVQNTVYIFLFPQLSPFQDGVTFSDVTTKFAERFFLFNPLYFKRNGISDGKSYD